MNYFFSEKDIKRISETLKSDSKEFNGAWSWSLKSPDNSKPLVFTIYNSVDLGGGITGSMVSVQTRHGYYELHGINEILFFEPDEIILIKSDDKYLSCLILGSECTCSVYSNIRRDILKSDFSELHPAVLLSAMQLSITESVID